MRETNVKTISLRLPDELAVALEAAARRRRVSTSAFVRNAVQHSLNDQSERISCFDLSADLVGGSSGPADLSTNSQYMLNFAK
ncbi:MAG: ribbon-helix-helix protein, CopG family [Candidatus Sumerlaeaceae bacterium]